jgi:hypothetical protein
MRAALTAVVFAALLAPPLAAADMHQSLPAALAPLAALAGSWEGKTSEGKIARLSVEVEGNVVLEKLMPDGEQPMVTVYQVDGDHLLMTHYCSAGNQPRMRAAIDAKQLDFRFQDATNLKAAEDPHMQALRVRFGDADHFTQVWTFHAAGKDDAVTFAFTRIAAQTT